MTKEQLQKKKTSGTLRGSQAPGTKAKEVVTRVDYNPERCKDYYEHGYCAFGDTCIYIHDRGDYKSGYQLDQEWEAKQRKKLAGADSEEESDYEIKSDQDDQA